MLCKMQEKMKSILSYIRVTNRAESIVVGSLIVSGFPFQSWVCGYLYEFSLNFEPQRVRSYFFDWYLNGVHFCGVKKPLLHSSWVATIVSYTFHWQMVPFHIPSLQLSLSFNCYKALSYVFSNFHGHKMHLLALLGLSTPKMTNFATLSFTSTSEFLTRSYTWA